MHVDLEHWMKWLYYCTGFFKHIDINGGDDTQKH